MGDLINGRTPEEIITGLKCEVPCHKCAYRDHNFMKDDSCSYYVEQDIIAYIEHLEAQQPKWISVKERLPEEAGKYIVCTRKKAVYCTAFRFFHGKGYFATDLNTHITHWMPLPEPPKEENV